MRALFRRCTVLGFAAAMCCALAPGRAQQEGKRNLSATEPPAFAQEHVPGGMAPARSDARTQRGNRAGAAAAAAARPPDMSGGQDAKRPNERRRDAWRERRDRYGRGRD